MGKTRCRHLELGEGEYGVTKWSEKVLNLQVINCLKILVMVMRRTKTSHNLMFKVVLLNIKDLSLLECIRSQEAWNSKEIVFKN